MIVLIVQIGQAMTSDSSVSTWRKRLAAILDFFTVVVGGGLFIVAVTGRYTIDPFSFDLSGFPALLWAGLMFLYYKVGKYYGGTLWQHILKTRT